MARPVFLFFDGLDAPIDLGGSESLVTLIREICPGWPIRLSDKTDIPPFFRATVEGSRVLAGCPDDTPKRLDPLNAVCDIVAALPDDNGLLSKCLLCLHAAAVRIGEGLVLFPNSKRAGKSTLSVALAERGAALFTDDYLRVRRGPDGAVLGVANGILPRLRLPVVDGLARPTGHQNRQYQYADVGNLPRCGDTAPLEALMFLERRPGEAPRLEPMTPDEAMRAMLYQNFGRHLHSATTLKVMAEIVEALPRHRLVYDRPDHAADLLLERMKDAEVPPLRLTADLTTSLLDDLPTPPVRLTTSGPLRHVEGVTSRHIGEGLYLADPEGRTIERLDPLGAAIWDMMAEPATAEDLVDVLSTTFPKEPRDRLATDVTNLLRNLARAGLIETP